MISQLTAAVRGGRVSCLELVQSAIHRIEELDGSINAVVNKDYQRATETAGKIDAAISRNEPVGPLAGIPVLVKDIEDVAGLPTTHGSLPLANAAPADEDGLVPGRLRAAGAIILGKTNAPEHAFEVYTANRLFGATCNPWNRDFSPGGSSGGSAAALAAGMVPVATATDGGGSIRIPGALSGLAGLKPTNGVVGRKPIPPWIDLSTDGPLATCMADLELLLAVEAGPVDGDPNAVAFQTLERPGSDVAMPRILAAPRTYDWGLLPAALESAFNAALGSLERDLGLFVDPIDAADIFVSGNPDLDWFVLCCTEQAHQLGRAYIDENADQLDPVFLGHMQYGLGMNLESYLGARRRRFEYVRDIDQLLGKNTILATPTMGVTGYLADGRMSKDVEPGVDAEAINTVALNITGNPAITLPAGVLPNGIPFGLQLVGPRFSDHLLLELGRRWERANPWPLAAPGFEPFSVEGLRL